MCGIAAIFAYGRATAPVERATLIGIRDRLAHRGPDAEGCWIAADGRIGLAHRRLSIIDVGSSANQPMLLEDNGIAIVFNGEIYNFRELRRSLEERGRVFRTQSDTEVLLHAYEVWGARMVDRLRGMYAFAIWDPRRGGLFLARDPFGIKPLYYCDDGARISISSEVQALARGGIGNARPSAAGQASFLLWGFIVEPHTLYRDIRALPAGSTLWVGPGGPDKPMRFWSEGDVFREAEERSPPLDLRHHLRDALYESVRDILGESVRYHFVSDVPVGVFLSGGYDSGMLVGLAAEQSLGDLRTLTLGFDELRGSGSDETALAQRIADAFGTNHQTRWVGADVFGKSRANILAAMDQPSIDGVNVYFISQMAAAAGLKVALSGLGGDELFGGYPSFRQIPAVVRLLSPFALVTAVGRGFRKVSAPILRHFTSPKYAGLFEYGTTVEDAYLLRRSLFMPWELPDILGPDIAREGWAELDPVARMRERTNGLASIEVRVSALEMGIYMRNQLLRDSDWAGMAHSLEIRVPFVDSVLLRQLAPFLMGPTRLGKTDMVNSLRKPLPDVILSRPKTGFAVPVREWLINNHLLGRGGKERGLRGWARLILQSKLGDERLAA
jgi:asparagine synthase (glutamine-hydrolysing)